MRIFPFVFYFNSMIVRLKVQYTSEFKSLLQRFNSMIVRLKDNEENNDSPEWTVSIL